jgi:hypothetical protein
MTRKKELWTLKSGLVPPKMTSISSHTELWLRQRKEKGRTGDS